MIGHHMYVCMCIERCTYIMKHVIVFDMSYVSTLSMDYVQILVSHVQIRVCIMCRFVSLMCRLCMSYVQIVDARHGEGGGESVRVEGTAAPQGGCEARRG